MGGLVWPLAFLAIGAGAVHWWLVPWAAHLGAALAGAL